MNNSLAPIAAAMLAFLVMTLGAADAAADSLVEGSVEAGKTKSMTCAACHGPDGHSVNPMWPNLAGQGAPYLLAQLKAFREGDRKDPVMSSQVQQLSDEDMADLAVFYESLPAAAQPVANAESVAKAEALYRGGDVIDQTSACIACHGPTGRGNPAAGYPALKGQHATYTAKQLRDYASGARQSDGNQRIMRQIATRLEEEEIVALASYVQGLR